MEHFSSKSTDHRHEAESHTVVETASKIAPIALLWRVVVAFAIVAGAGFIAFGWVANKPEPVQRQARERSFTIGVQPAQKLDHRADINSFGEIIAARTLDVRTQVSGEVVELSPNFVVGGEITNGELLMAIDSFNYDGTLTEAKAALADAQVQRTIFEEQLKLEQSKLQAASAQLAIAERDLERAKTLVAAGSLTDKALEDRELIVSQRQQTFDQNQSNIAVQKAGLTRQETIIDRAAWAEAQAQRSVDNTRIYAPFDGVVVSENAEMGRFYSNSEVIAQFYEQNALEVRFTLTDKQYGQLLQDGLVGRTVKAIWNIAARPVQVEGQIARIGAQVNAALGGVEVFAQLHGVKGSGIRPGAYVTVSVEGPLYRNAYRIAETALYENDHVYVFENERMKRVDVDVLSRIGADLIVAGDFANDAQIVTTHLAQAGDGLLVNLATDEDVPAAETTKAPQQTPNTDAKAERPLPAGAVRNSDGSVTFADGRTRFPDGRMVDAEGNVLPGRQSPANGPTAGKRGG